MAFFSRAYSTTASDKPCIADSATTIPPGHAVICKVLPTDLVTPQAYFKVAVAGPTDTVLGTVSVEPTANTVTNMTPGRVAFINASGLIPVRMNAAGTKGDLIKVKTADGKWEKIAMGETPLCKLLEDVAAGDLGWAQPL